MDILARRLLEFRTAKGFTQKDLADKAGVPQSAISDIEAGKRTPRIDTLIKLAVALEVTVADLIENNSVGYESLTNSLMTGTG